MKRRRRLNTFLFHLLFFKKEFFFSVSLESHAAELKPVMTRQHFQQKRFFIFLRLVIGTATTTKKDDDQLYKVKEASLLYCVVSDGRYHKRTRWSIPSRCDVPPFPFKKKMEKRKKEIEKMTTSFFFLFFCVVWYRHSLASKKKSPVECAQLSFRLMKNRRPIHKFVENCLFIDYWCKRPCVDGQLWEKREENQDVTFHSIGFNHQEEK